MGGSRTTSPAERKRRVPPLLAGVGWLSARWAHLGEDLRRSIAGVLLLAAALVAGLALVGVGQAGWV
ncbi:MAG: hypothetical protein IRY95_02065, partial [Clostridia bacterium]|nr:hypothetical protein [Clostridia bacterium]